MLHELHERRTVITDGRFLLKAFVWIVVLTALTGASDLLLEDVTDETEDATRGPLPYCSLFTNRAPHPEHKLVKCSWFHNDACCYQEEVDRIFPTVVPPRGANQNCTDHLYYLMCYICSPRQHLFYSDEVVTICEELCNRLFEACANATLKGQRIGEQYSSGRDYCVSRKFRVGRQSSGSCYSHNFSVVEDIDPPGSHQDGVGGSVSLVVMTLIITRTFVTAS
ncbi:Hypp5025 [Branchiostoma lanceolatum]|uniref:Hypp5025 protein n=1 Tax=Branchiostoma lanceolatum TaxID=7740 RepID=A0A8K0EXW8_BRALA|nr:Hypp5025 [Branchiostoma lanceolatum]